MPYSEISTADGANHMGHTIIMCVWAKCFGVRTCWIMYRN